ncbi:MAG: DnaJ domain-containing protein [Bifidobacteriaceae bacterium]|jgi:molecular chaperone DnaJ|nr:DnaJ domain-containing protein [Bifidobacteriaceae bacterium]
MSEQDWLNKDYYKVLGLTKSASDDEIKKAYRKLARKLHPDQNKDNPQAEEQFKEVTAAYEVLSKPESKKRYDAIRQMGSGGARFMGGYGQTGATNTGSFNDVFSTFGTGGQRSYTYSTGGFGGGSLNDIIDGLFQNARTQGTAGGAGNQGANAWGQGADPFSAQSATPIANADVTISFRDAVYGTEVGLSYEGKNLRVKIPAGVNDGQTIKVKRPSVEIQIKVAVEKDAKFSLDGLNVRCTLPVRFDELVLGTSIQVETAYGETVTMKVPEFTKNGGVLRIRGKGVKGKTKTGDMLVTLNVQVPRKLSTKQRNALQEFRDASKNRNPRE